MNNQTLTDRVIFIICQYLVLTPLCRAEVSDKTTGPIELWGITLFMLICVGMIAGKSRKVAVAVWLVGASISLVSLLETHSSGLHELLLAEQGWFWAYQNHACLAAYFLALPLILKKRSSSGP